MRWPQLLLALGLRGRPGPRAFNGALVDRGFRDVVDENLALQTMLTVYPDAWWFAIAKETTGREDAAVRDVVAGLNARTAAHAAQ